MTRGKTLTDEFREQHEAKAAAKPNGKPHRAAVKVTEQHQSDADESGGPESEPPPEPVGTLLSTVTPERVEWLWPGRIPRGKLTILDGDPGLGKSCFTMDLAARVSMGLAMPDGPSGNKAAGVVILNAEDGLADTVVPRLTAAGANLERVLALDKLPCEGGTRLPVLPQDLIWLRSAIKRMGAGLVVVDPLMAFLDGHVNAHRDQDVRRALHPLSVLADQTHAAVLVVRHLNKAMGGSAIHRGGGSIGIIGAARSAMLIAKDPDDDTRRVLASTKCNLARLPPSLSFSLESEPEPDGALRIGWIGVCSHTAESLLATPNGDTEERDALEAGKDVLCQILAVGPMGAADVKAEAKKAGLSTRTLDRAKQALRIVAVKADFQGGWRWSLPGDS